MIRVLLILLSFNTIGYAQQPTVKLTYTQTITYDTPERASGKKETTLFNSFQPFLMAHLESVSAFSKEVYIDHKYIYTETYLSNQQGIFATKYQANNEVFYINEMTGEKKPFIALNNKPLPETRKHKSQKGTSLISDNEYAYEVYQVENKNMLIEYHVARNMSMKQKKGLYNKFYHKGGLVLQQRSVYKEEGKEVILKLNTIDTLDNKEGYIKNRINKIQKLNTINKQINIDGIAFNLAIPDIYIKQIDTYKIVSLNNYKNNGKYLVVDFWGTWCKPCIASIPELKAFYKSHSDSVDLLSLNYKDANMYRVKAKIEETGMTWDHGIATEQVNELLNPQTYFPGIVVFDDDMKLIFRGKAKEGLIFAENLLDK